MNIHLTLRCVLALCLGALLVGCQSADDPSTEIDLVPVTTVSASTSTPANAPDDKPITAAAPNASSDTVSNTAIQRTFDPPFPDRVDLFEPPQRAQSRIRRDDEYGEAVELKGFINVGEPRVILAIGEEVSPLPEGGERYGVKVISIQPPSVVLQRGRTRWTATLE